MSISQCLLRRNPEVGVFHRHRSRKSINRFVASGQLLVSFVLSPDCARHGGSWIRIRLRSRTGLGIPFLCEEPHHAHGEFPSVSYAGKLGKFCQFAAAMRSMKWDTQENLFPAVDGDFRWHTARIYLDSEMCLFSKYYTETDMRLELAEYGTISKTGGWWGTVPLSIDNDRGRKSR